MSEDRNKLFMHGLNTFKKRAFSVDIFSQNNIDTQKGLSSQKLHKDVIEKYKVTEAKGEYLSLKVKKIY